MKILNRFIAFLTVFLLVIQLLAINAVAVLGYLTTYPRLSDFRFLSITSRPYENAQNPLEEKFSYKNSSGGLYDRNIQAKQKHHRGQVDIRFLQRGYTEGTTLTIDGKRITHGISIDSESGYIPETGRFGVIAWIDEYTAYNLDDAATESEIKLTATVNDENGFHTYTQTLTVEWIDDGGPAPTGIGFKYDAESGKAVLQNVNSTMEYRRKGTTNKDWKPCTDAPMEFAIPASNVQYHFRYAATENEPVSKVTTITLEGRRKAPSCSYNSYTEVLSGLTDKMEISYSDDKYEPVPSGTTSISLSEHIEKLSDGETATVKIRYPATEYISESYYYYVNLYPRAKTSDDLVYDPVTLTLSGVSSAMHYRLSGTEYWWNVSGTTLNLAQYASVEDDVTILIRYKPTSTNTASNEKAFTIKKLLEGPTGEVDYTNEIISGFNDDTAYQYYVGTPSGTTAWSKAVISNGNFDISKIITTSARTVNIRKASTDTAPITHYTAFNIPARLKAPATPAFSYNDENHYGKVVLTGVTSDMEYKISNDTSWTSVGNDDVVIDIPNANTIYYVRYKATSENFASSYKSITLYGKSSAPRPTYNTTTETFTGLSTAMEISYNGSEYSAIDATSMNMSERINDLTEAMTVNIRYAATATSPASVANTFTIYPRLAAPTSVVYNKATVSLTGINNTMQYRLETNSSWTALSGTTLYMLSFASAEKDVKVLVRYKPTNTNAASLPVEFTIPKLLDGPSCNIDYLNEKIVGLDDNTSYQYFIGNNPSTTANWASMQTVNGGFDISNIATNAIRVINIRKAATTDEPITNYTTLNLPARKSAPTTPYFVYNNENHYGKIVLAGATSDMEYKIYNDTSWTSVGNDDIVLDIPNANTTYYIRYKSTSEDFASLNKSIILYGKSSAPRPTYNTTTETFTGLSTTMEISYNGSEYTAIDATSMNMSEKINDITEAMTVNIRYAATATYPASVANTFTIYPRLAAPTTVVYNSATISLTGISNKMQYRFETNPSWTTLSGTTLNLTYYANKEQDLKVLVRYAPTNTNAASLSVEFTIPKLIDGPSCSIDYLNEKIIGLDDNTSYQYIIGNNPSTTANWGSVQTVNGSFDISNFATNSSKIINIRKAATTDAPITNYTTLNIPARTAAPTTPYFVYNNEKHYGKIVLAGVTSDMEYKIYNDTSWTPVENNDIVLDIPNANTTYYIRYKSTSESFASLNKSIILYGKSSAPRPTYNTTTETFTGLSTTMEISYNGSEYTAIDATSINMSERINDLTEAMTVNIRYAATATSPASVANTFTIYPRLAAPTTVVYNSATISLTGISNKMQYRFETNPSWTALSGTTLNLTYYASKEQDLKVLVRYAPTNTNAASLSVEFTIPKLIDGPSCSIDYLNEKIIGLDDNTSYQYIIGNNPSTTANWGSVQTVNGGFDISNFATNANRVINIRKAATSNEPVTNYTTLNMPARKAAPTTPYFVYNNENYYGKAVLAGVTSDMEYKMYNDTSWTSVGNDDVVLDVPTANTTCYVRYKSTQESFASLNRSVTLYGKTAAPRLTYNSTTETITGLSAAMEISYNGSEYTAINATSINLSDKIEFTEPLTVNVRRYATATSPASLDGTIVIYPRANTPTSIIYDNANVSLTGINNPIQYRLETSTSWSTFTGSTFSLLPYVSKENDVKIFVRYSPSTTHSASLPVEFVIPKLLDGPSCSIDYTNEKIVGLNDSTPYQYFIGTNPSTTANWTSMQTIDGEFDISGFITTFQRVINIRKASANGEPITNYTTLYLPARRYSPSTPYFVYNDDNYYEKVVLTDITPDMEYKLSTDSEWSEIIGNELVFDVPDYGMTYYIRYKSTSESFSSSYKSLTLLNRRTAPSCIYDQSTQTITKLSNSMEIKIGEVGSYTPVTSTTYDLSDVFLSTDFVTIYIRYKATNTQPASYIQVIPCNCNADVVSDELDFVFNDTTVDNYDVVNPNEEFDNTSDDVTMENDNPLNPNDEFDEPFVEPIAEDCNITQSYVFNNDIVI